jgi:signal transduction histidine kinase
VLFSRTSRARTPSSRGFWTLCRLQSAAWIINLFAAASLSIFSNPLRARSNSAAAGQPKEKNVLVLFSSIQTNQSFLDLIEPPMRARVRGPITFYDAFLEDPQVEEKSFRESMSETLRRRYAQVKLDVVIACNPAALHFAVEYRDKIFPGVPIVFVGVGAGDLKNQKIWPGVTGVASPWGFRETIELMLRLEPDTKTIAVVAGDTRWDEGFVAVAHSELLLHQDKVAEIDVVGPPDHQLYERVAALPPHTIVLFQAFPQFSSQPEFGTWDLVTAISQRLPTYSSFPSLCINGCIGGAYEDVVKEDLWTAEIAARVLSGERADNIPVAYATDLQVRVDWRALHRWQIPESALALGSVVLNREPTLWEQYRKYVVAAIAVIAVQLLLILGLLWQRTKRRKIEASLVGSNKELKRSEASLQQLSGRLIDAQEQERSRIARELHDDFSQRMALLQIGLQQIENENKAGFSSQARQQLHNTSELASEISSNLHDLSHQLHPSRLDTLGLMSALRGLCKEFSQQHKLEVQFVHKDIPEGTPKDVTLCLFRIAQEALRNVVKHSGASAATVEVSGRGDCIDLCISDAGVGFETKSAKGAAGLGLISMRERLRLVGGDIVVESEPSHGTRLHVHVPLPTSDAAVTKGEKGYKAEA